MLQWSLWRSFNSANLPSRPLVYCLSAWWRCVHRCISVMRCAAAMSEDSVLMSSNILRLVVCPSRYSIRRVTSLRSHPQPRWPSFHDALYIFWHFKFQRHKWRKCQCMWHDRVGLPVWAELAAINQSRPTVWAELSITCRYRVIHALSQDELTNPVSVVFGNKHFIEEKPRSAPV